MMTILIHFKPNLLPSWFELIACLWFKRSVGGVATGDLVNWGPWLLKDFEPQGKMEDNKTFWKDVLWIARLHFAASYIMYTICLQASYCIGIATVAILPIYYYCE